MYRYRYILLRQIAVLLSAKWNRPYSAIRAYVNSRISLALVRATHLCFRGSRTPAHTMSHQRYLYDDAEGLYCLHRDYFPQLSSLSSVLPSSHALTLS